MLETMLAFAMLGVVLVTTYSLSVRSIRQQIEARQGYELIEMARAVLDEYVLTYPEMRTSGSYKDTWDWQITEERQEALESTDYDYYFEFVRITAFVKRKASKNEPVELSTIVARRAPGI